MIFRITGLTGLAMLLATTLAGADGLPLFADRSLLEIRLEGPVSSAIRDTRDRNRYAMRLTVEGAVLDVDVRVRGHSRTRACQFPPLRLYIGDDAIGTAFAGQDKLKVVTHCVNRNRNDANLLEEYTAYRLLQVLTDKAYRTRLVRLTYVDTDDRLPKSAREHLGFILESRDELADRLNGDKENLEGIKLSELDQKHAALIYVFQYMIGNTDWSLVMAEADDKCCHNVDLMRVSGDLLPIPYDFDLSGLVNPNYAKPDASLPIRTVTQRLYRGYCIDVAALEAAVLHVNTKRGEIMQTVAEIPTQEPKINQGMARYLEKFFREAEDAEKFVRRIDRRCVS